MYCIDGEVFPLEMLTADEARTVLRDLRTQAVLRSLHSEAVMGTLHAQVAVNTDQDRALATQIDEVAAWLEQLDAEDAGDAAADHAADMYADYLVGIH